MTLLEIDEVRGGYAEVDILNGISLSLQKGEILTVAGTNGAGKSTLLRAVLGLTPAQGGAVRILGDRPEAMRGQVGWLPQRAAVDWDFPASALDVVAMAGTRRTRWFGPLPRAEREAHFLIVGTSVTSTAAGGKPAWSEDGGTERLSPPRA